MKAFLVIVLVAACGTDPTARPVEELRDPNTCKECHEQHYTQWSGSMHAYASEDPVFVAMNKRGQRETNNALGDFCVKCHAPMAVELGLTDGTNFDPAALPAEAKGITCYFCHNVDKVIDTHNNGLVIAGDQTMRGGAKNPVESPAHFSKYDPLMDSDTNQSEMCGGCHDVVVPQRINGVADVALERTFTEWQQTFFSSSTDAQLHLTCGGCHMISKRDLIADGPGLNVSPRDFGFHDHRMASIDQAMTDFPDTAGQQQAITEILDPALRTIGPANLIAQIQPGGICLDPDGLKIRVDNLGAGHAIPSGAAQDRRMWLEVKATDTNGMPVFTSGVVAPDADPVDTPGFINVDTVGLWDRAFKADNTPAHFFWEVTRVDSQLMPIPLVAGGDHSINAKWNVANPGLIDRIETRVLIRPFAIEALNELVASGDLDPAIAARMQTIVFAGGTSVWTAATAGTGPDAKNTHCNPP